MDLLRSIFKGDKVIWIIFLFLCLISIVEVFSAASTLTYKSGDHWGPITQHSIILMVGAVVVVFMHNIPYKWFQVFPVFLLPLQPCYPQHQTPQPYKLCYPYPHPQYQQHS